MAYHKLLSRQLNKFSNSDLAADENFTRFIEAINYSYQAFDRDKELSDHAFKISEQEFLDINSKLKEEVEIRKLSIQKLKDTLFKLTEEDKDPCADSDQDLIEIVDLLNIEIARRRAVEQQLHLAKEEAEKASVAKSDFLSIISHEIRTPLNAVLGMGHLLLKQNPRFDQIENLKILKTSADNLLVLINDILDFNKIESGQLDLEEETFNLKKLTKDIVLANTNAANDRENKISLVIDERMPEYFIGDPIRMGQILNNLISNAVKFTQKGKVLITIRLENLISDNATIRFSVSDTGLGIDQTKHSAIFLPFTQASTSITRQYGGTGLGLAITKQILGLLNSEIHLISEIGKGSEFYFTINFKVGDSQIELGDGDTINFDLKNKRILLVEDTLFNVMYATQLLTGWNAVVDVAENGAIAVEKLTTETFDLVLMDLQMPVMDGFTATLKIRELNITVPIIALTASVSANVKEKVLKVGMQDYVTKPFNPDDFFVKLKKYLN